MKTYPFQSGLRILFSLLLMCLYSWVFVHIFALTGLFLAIGYLVWVFFTYPSNGLSYGLLFRRIAKVPGANQDNSSAYKPSVRKALYPYLVIASNFVFILILTAASYVVVRLELHTLERNTAPAQVQKLSFDIPTKGQYSIGEVITVPISISGVKEPINVVQSDLAFEPDKLEVINVSTTGSFANVFVQREINNTAGYVRLTGGLPNPGFQGDKGLFGTVYFRAKASGATQISYLPSSLILENDGEGTNVLNGQSSIPLVILPEVANNDQLANNTSVLESVERNAKQEEQLVFFDSTSLPATQESPTALVTPQGTLPPSLLKEPTGPGVLSWPFWIIKSLDNRILDWWNSAGLGL